MVLQLNTMMVYKGKVETEGKNQIENKEKEK